MVWIPGGEFTLGSDAPVARADERPPHRARVHGFWIDATEVTNAQFRAFVGATGYVTTAERAPTLDEIMQQVPPGTPPPPPEALVPASLVFTPPQREVSLADPAAWWQIVPGADWQHPSGPQSSIEGLDELPVVHVSWHDAVAYAGWAEKRLPTEAEWECAARGGRENQVYSWGDEPPSEENPLANIWHGRFPTENTRADGFAALAPVRSFPPNGYGLYDVAGNVWEWCSDWYRADTYRMRAAHGLAIDPQGPETSLDPNDPYAPKRVQRGGSFLCHASYCLSYRPSARMGGAPDTGACHVGFRCAKDAREGAASGR